MVKAACALFLEERDKMEGISVDLSTIISRHAKLILFDRQA
jgi:hypothetical protein